MNKILIRILILLFIYRKNVFFSLFTLEFLRTEEKFGTIFYKIFTFICMNEKLIPVFYIHIFYLIQKINNTINVYFKLFIESELFFIIQIYILECNFLAYIRHYKNINHIYHSFCYTTQ